MEFLTDGKGTRGRLAHAHETHQSTQRCVPRDELMSLNFFLTTSRERKKIRFSLTFVTRNNSLNTYISEEREVGEL